MKNYKKNRIPRSKGIMCLDIVLMLVICFLIQRPVAAYFTYLTGVLLTSIVALAVFFLDYLWVKKKSKALTPGKYKRYQSFQAIVLFITLCLIMVINWVIRN